MRKQVDPLIVELKKLGKRREYASVFRLFNARKLPSKATDIYTMASDGNLDVNVIKELLNALAALGIGRFGSSRSFSWEGFDLRLVARAALSKNDGKGLGVGRLMRRGSEASRWVQVDSRANVESGNVGDISLYSVDELLAALQAKGLDVAKKPKK